MRSFPSWAADPARLRASLPSPRHAEEDARTPSEGSAAPASSVSDRRAAAVAEDYGDKDEGRSPCSLRAAPLLAASGSSRVQAGKRHGVIEKMFVDSSTGSEATSVVITKLKE